MIYLYDEIFEESCEEVANRLKKEDLDFVTMKSRDGENVIYSITVAPKFSDCMMEIFMNNCWETPTNTFYLFRVITNPKNDYEVPEVGYATIDSLVKTIKSRREMLEGKGLWSD